MSILCKALAGMISRPRYFRFLRKHFVVLMLAPLLWSLGAAARAEPEAPNLPAVRAVTPLFTLKGREGDPLMLPSDVAVEGQRTYVVDGGNHRIVVFDEAGHYLNQFGSRGDGPGQLLYPVGIAAGDNGRIYVADSSNHRVQVFSNEGQFVSQFPIVDQKNNPIRPIDVLKPIGEPLVVVTGNTNHRVMVYSLEGKLVRQWGGKGTQPGLFSFPATLAQLPDKRLAVIDALNARVQIFTMKGDYSTGISEWGVLAGQTVRPKGIAIDPGGHYFISDSYMGLVQEFSERGLFVGLIASKNDPSGRPIQFDTPVGMTVDKKNRLYITEMKKNQVSVYQLD